MTYTYGKPFKHPRVYALVCYRYKGRIKKGLCFANSKKLIPLEDYK